MKTLKNIAVVSTLLTLTSTLLAQSLSSNFNDTLYSKQWAMKNSGQTVYLQDSDLTRLKVVGIPGIDINFLDTDQIPTEKQELIVAVLDSGIDLTHPDLQGKIWYNSKLCNNAPNAKNLPCNGYNFLDNNTTLTDDVGHGTHVAGIIAANRNNLGIVGASDRRIKIMPLKVLNNSVNGFVYNGKLITDVIADAMIFAIKNGAEVINLSLGWPKLIDTPKVRAAFQMAEEQNVTVIAAAGNNNKDLPTFPCSYESVICVGAHDNQGKLTDFTNHGTKVDVVAPGEYIISTFPTNMESRVLRIKNYEVKRGSSQAAPFVTASIAKLKLLNPSLKNDDVKTLLYSSSVSLSGKEKRFVKFGRLNQTQLLSTTDRVKDSFVYPLTKNITEVKFKLSDSKFNFTLPIKNLGRGAFSGKICFQTESMAISLENACEELNLNSGEMRNISVTGTIMDLDADSQVALDVTINDQVFNLPIFFTRDLNRDQSLDSFEVLGGKFDEMAVISSGRKLSRMARVLDKNQLMSFPEYFYLEKAKQSEKNTVVSLLTKTDTSFSVQSIVLPKVNRVLSIHRQDINLDGKMDYMVYTLSNSKDVLNLFFFDKNLNPLFGENSSWNFPLSTFEGLPIDGGLEKFDWIKIATNDFGTILVPSINRIYDMPEEDNSKNILERIVSKQNHQYYLEPVKQNNSITLKLRVVDSVSFIKEIRKQLAIDPSMQIDIVKSLPQSEEQYKAGIVRILLRATNGETTEYYEVNANQKNARGLKINSSLPLDGAASYNFFDVEAQKFTNQTVFSSLVSRSRANYVMSNDGDVDYAKDFINAWENPVIGIIGSFINSQGKLFIMENRYSVALWDAKGAFKSELPIYRDSSFPGQNFSETLSPIVSNKRPGVFINSTLIFGERLYSMIVDNDTLVRPMKLSVSIPDNCVPLAPEYLGAKDSSKFAFICTELNQKVSIKFLSM